MKTILQIDTSSVNVNWQAYKLGTDILVSSFWTSFLFRFSTAKRNKWKLDLGYRIYQTSQMFYNLKSFRSYTTFFLGYLYFCDKGISLFYLSKCKYVLCTSNWNYCRSARDSVKCAKLAGLQACRLAGNRCKERI